MIDPKTTDIIGQRVLIVQRGDPEKIYARGIVRVVDYRDGRFSFLIESVGTFDFFGVVDGQLFEVNTWSETEAILVDRSKP